MKLGHEQIEVDPFEYCSHEIVNTGTLIISMYDEEVVYVEEYGTAVEAQWRSKEITAWKKAAIDSRLAAVAKEAV